MRRLLLALVLVSSAGCFEDIQQASTVNGAYSLQSVNGSALPFTSTSGATTTITTDDVMTLFQGFTYSETAHRRITTNGVASDVTVNETGSFLVLGTSMTFTSSDAKHVRVAIGDGTRMTIIEGANTMVYSK